jgi:hypothetical protein
LTFSVNFDVHWYAVSTWTLSGSLEAAFGSCAHKGSKQKTEVSLTEESLNVLSPGEGMKTLNLLDHQVCLTAPSRLAPSGWIEHVPFAMYLIDVLRPRTLVELGSWYGVSYCAFCQTVETLDSDTRCFAVDTWRGDPHAGDIGDHVLAELKAHHDPRYSHFSRLMQMTFDEAVAHFEDGSIDLLHIDGYHTYDAVRHDFESWLPRMSERGVILFHDVAEHKLDFGVWRFWEELKTRYPSYEVEFGHGLGLLAVGCEQPSELHALLRSECEEVDLARAYFRRLGRLVRGLNEADLFKREMVARYFQTAAEEAARVAQADWHAARAAEKLAQIRRAHPLLTRASNLLQELASDGLGMTVSLGASRLGLRRDAKSPRASTSRNAETP